MNPFLYVTFHLPIVNSLPHLSLFSHIHTVLFMLDDRKVAVVISLYPKILQCAPPKNKQALFPIHMIKLKKFKFDVIVKHIVCI